MTPDMHDFLFSSTTPRYRKCRYAIRKITINDERSYVWSALEHVKHSTLEAMTAKRSYIPRISDSHVRGMKQTWRPQLDNLAPSKKRCIQRWGKQLKTGKDGMLVIPELVATTLTLDQNTVINRGVLTEVKATIGHISSLNNVPRASKNRMSHMSHVAAEQIRIHTNDWQSSDPRFVPLHANSEDKATLFKRTMMGILPYLRDKPAKKRTQWECVRTHNRKHHSPVNNTVWITDNLIDAESIAAGNGRLLDTGLLISMITENNGKGNYSIKLGKDTVYYNVITIVSGNPNHSGRATAMAVMSLHPIKEEVLV